MSPHQSYRTRQADFPGRAAPGDDNGGLFLSLVIGAVLIASLLTPRPQPPEEPPDNAPATRAQTSSATAAPATGAEIPPTVLAAEGPETEPPAH